MANRQYFGIKYPFTKESYEGFFVDANATLKDKVRSQLLHIIFTPKGQRLRNPEFGTDLIKYIFEMNDTDSWESVKNEISDAVSKYLPNVVMRGISVMQSTEESSEIYVRIDFTVIEGNLKANDSIVTTI